MNINNIGNGVISVNKKEWRRYYRGMLLSIGAMPGYYDSGQPKNHKKKEKRLSPERFSTNYKTRDEFEDDREKILDYLSRMEYAPEDLVNKVAETVTELNLRFGE